MGSSQDFGVAWVMPLAVVHLIEFCIREFPVCCVIICGGSGAFSYPCRLSALRWWCNGVRVSMLMNLTVFGEVL